MAGRAYTNLGWAYSALGDHRLSRQATLNSVAQAEREGNLQNYWFAQGNLLGNSYDVGLWDEALDLVVAMEGAPDGARVLTATAGEIRGRILVARDRPDEGLRDMLSAIEGGRSSNNLQSHWPALASYARAAFGLGLGNKARAALDEITSAIAAHSSVGYPSSWHVEYVRMLRDTGRMGEARDFSAQLTQGRWRSVCDAITAGDDVGAADLAAETGNRPLEAELRLSAATTLASEGRIAEAEAQLGLARAFWETVGATAFLRRADELIAAAS